MWIHPQAHLGMQTPGGPGLVTVSRCTVFFLLDCPHRHFSISQCHHFCFLWYFLPSQMSLPFLNIGRILVSIPWPEPTFPSTCWNLTASLTSLHNYCHAGQQKACANLWLALGRPCPSYVWRGSSFIGTLQSWFLLPASKCLLKNVSNEGTCGFP